jgi:hypothetical protein
MINVARLDEELRAAGIPIDGCNSAGTIFFKVEATTQQKTQAAAIVAAHDGTKLSEADKRIAAAKKTLRDAKAAGTLSEVDKALITLILAD